ncbi:MAG TPA: fatty acyl-AMP ligase [Pseudonocardiaceae bacterium]|nr:fatty acyl-AMP ligase [Pseudonocardiaceae bacterium]
MGDVSTPRTLLEAMSASADITDRGFTFVDERGPERCMSFREVSEAAHRQAGALQALGFAPGERVALIIPEQYPFIITFLAALAARLIPVPIYPPFSLAKVENWRQATEGILRIAGPTAIVTVDEVCPLLWSTASRLNAKILTLRQLAMHADVAFTPAAVDPEDLAFLQFTSGSTRAPRGVMVSHRNIMENCTRITHGFLRSIEIKGVSWLPLYHDMGLIGCVLAPLLALRPVVFLDTLAFLKRPTLWFDLIHRHRATVTFAPQFAFALAVRRVGVDDLAKWDLSCLRVAGCGAEPIAAQTLRSFATHFAAAGLRPDALCPSYGLAEATLIVTYSPVGEHWQSQVVDAERLLRHGEAAPPVAGAKTLEFVSCGTIIADHALRILDKRGRPLPEGRVGEIEIQGPSVTHGYFDDPDATAQSYAGGWLRTGDLGYLARARLFVTGRDRDLVIVRGRNYAPQTIEWALDGLQSIRAGNIVAFAYPSAHGVDQLAIVCEARVADAVGVERDVRTRVNEELALTVDDVLVLPPGMLPKTSSGKVQRAKTRTLFLDGALHRIAQAKRSSRLTRLSLAARLRWHAVLGWIQYRNHHARQFLRRDTIKDQR